MTTRSMPRLYQAVLLTIVVLGLVGYYWEGRGGTPGSEGIEDREGVTVVVGDTKEKARIRISSEEAEKEEESEPTSANNDD